MRKLINQRYKVVRLLGKGGMGAVYLARDLARAGEFVALKTIRSDLVQAYNLAQFKQEFAALRQLRHPNLAPVFDFEVDANTGDYFFTMEYVEGEDLPALLRSRSFNPSEPVDVQWLYDIIVQVCRALQYIHSRGLIHHDIKPSNIRVALSGQARLMDMGLISEVHGDAPVKVRGTPEYIAPEMIRGDPVDQRADLYSLGISLYEIFTGRLPFTGESSMMLIRQHVEDAPPPPSKFVRGMPAGLHALILRLIEKEPSRRFGSADQVIEALNNLTDGGVSYPLETPATRSSYILSSRLVGREDELTRLQGLLLRTMQGEGRLVLLSGPMGIGKTRLARELKLQAQLRRVLVVESICPSQERGPYYPWVRILEQVITYRRGGKKKISSADAAALAHWLPGLAAQVGLLNPRQVEQNEQQRLFEAVYHALCGAGRPVLVILEDYHHADAETVELTLYLSRRANHDPLLICVLYREDELGDPHPLRAIAETAEIQSARDESIAEIDNPAFLALEPLDENGVDLLLKSMLGSTELPASFDPEVQPITFSAQLMQITGGNPLLIEMVMREFSDAELIRYEQGDWQFDEQVFKRAPTSIQELALRRLEHLPEETLGFFQWAAVIGSWLDRELLSAVTGRQPEEIHHHLTAAVRQNILAVAFRPGGGSAYRFSADPIRQAIYETLPAEDRKERHARVAVVLERLRQRDEILELLAYHYERAGEYSRSLGLFHEAADKARQLYANEYAIALYTRALALIDQHPTISGGEKLFELLRGRESCYALLGNRPAQRADLERMKQTAAALHDASQEIEAVIRMAKLDMLLGNYTSALHAADSALNLAQAIENRKAMADVLTLISEAAYWLDDLARTKSTCDQALSIFRVLGDQAGEARCVWLLGVVARREDNPALTKAYFSQSLALYRSLGDRVGEADALNGLGVVETNFAHKRDYYEQTLAIAEALGDKLRKARTLNNLGLLYSNLGLYRKARQYLENSVRMAREFQGRGDLVYALESLGRVYAELEDFTSAETVLTEGRRLAEETGSRINVSLYLLAIGRLALARGQYGVGQEYIHEACQIQREMKQPNYLTTSLSWLGLACLLNGDWASAEGHTSDALHQLSLVEGTGSFPTQDVWWLRYRVLQQRSVVLTEDETRFEVEARYCLQRAHDVMLSSIATLSDEGLRRNYLNRIRLNREILNEWVRRFSVTHAEQEPEIKDFSDAAVKSATELAQARSQFKRVLDISSQMTQARDVRVLLEYVMDQVIELSGAERGFLVLFDDAGRIDVRVARGMSKRDVENTHNQLSFTVMGAVSRTHQPILLQDALADEHYGRQSSVLDLHLRSVLCAPLLSHGELLGMVYADNRSISGRFSQADLDMLTIFASQAAAAIENARLHEETRKANQELEKAAHTLERKVGERTSELKARSQELQVANQSLTRRALQLKTSSQVASQITSILNVEKLLREVVRLIQSQFGYYFVGVWLLTTGEDFIELKAGYPDSLWTLPAKLELVEESTLTMVCQTGKPRYVARKRDTAHLNPGRLPHTRSELALPLRMGKRTMGVLDIHHKAETGFDDEDQMALQSLADQIAIAIRNAQLYKTELERRQIAEAMERAGRATSSSLDLREVPYRIIEQLATVVPYERGAIWVNRDNNLHLMAHHGFPEDERIRGLVLPVRKGDVFQQIVSKGQPVMVEDTEKEPGWMQIDWLPVDHSWLGVPLIVKDQVVGMLSLTRKEAAAFTKTDAQRAIGFAIQAAIALDNASLYDRILKFNERLEQVVEERTQELNRAYLALQSLDKAKTSFIDVAAHELRTPLTTIHGYSYLLLENPATEQDKELRTLAQGILRGAGRLQEIINSILDVAKIDSQSLHVTLDWTNVAALAYQARDDFATALRDRQLNLEFSGLDEVPAFKADSTLVFKALVHLIGNAIKYTPDGGRITVRGCVVEENGFPPEVELVISDTGIGIAEEDRSLIFEKFRQRGDISLHSSGRTKFKGGGPGLGLAIARGIVLAHGGRIWVESDGYDEKRCPGSSFYIRLPFVTSEEG